MINLYTQKLKCDKCKNKRKTQKTRENKRYN